MNPVRYAGSLSASGEAKALGERGIFLTAEWRNLLMLNYAVLPSLLLPHVPAGTKLDDFEGKTYMSLVAFEFNRTRVRGLSIPFHRSFEEVNLRFYVKREGRRGVVFIRELVPRIAIAAVARIIYGEKYSCVPMAHTVKAEGDEIRAEFSWGKAPGRCSVSATMEGGAFLPKQGSLEQFITEHYWGYARQRDGGSVEYEVQHPQWLVRNSRATKLLGDVSRYYGEELAAQMMAPPDSAFLAEGSDVTVFKGERLA